MKTRKSKGSIESKEQKVRKHTSSEIKKWCLLNLNLNINNVIFKRFMPNEAFKVFLELVKQGIYGVQYIKNYTGIKVNKSASEAICIETPAIMYYLPFFRKNESDPLAFATIISHKKGIRIVQIYCDEEYRNKGVTAVILKCITAFSEDAKCDLYLDYTRLSEVMIFDKEFHKTVTEMGFTLVWNDDEGAIYYRGFNNNDDSSMPIFIPDDNGDYQLPASMFNNV